MKHTNSLRLNTTILLLLVLTFFINCGSQAIQSPATTTRSTLPTKPAEFTVSDILIEPKEALIGESIKAVVTIQNKSEVSGIYTAILKLADKELSRQDVSIKPSTSEKAIFEFKSPETEGTYQISIGTSINTLSVKTSRQYTIKYDNDKPGTFWPARPNLNLIIFYKPPSAPFIIQNIKIFGALNGTPVNLDTETFKLIIWNKDRTRQLWSKDFSFSPFNVKGGKWVDFAVDNAKVTEDFFVEFDLAKRKCVLYIPTDVSVQPPSVESYRWADVNTEGVLKYSVSRDIWMVRIQGIAP